MTSYVNMANAVYTASKSASLSCNNSWWHGVAVTHFIRSTKLLYAGPG